MASRLDEIKQLLESIDRWIAIRRKYEELYPDGWTVNQQNKEDRQRYMEGYAAIEKMKNNHYEYLKLLLPIVEEARVMVAKSKDEDGYFDVATAYDVEQLANKLKALD